MMKNEIQDTIIFNLPQALGIYYKGGIRVCVCVCVCDKDEVALGKTGGREGGRVKGICGSQIIC